MKPRTVQVTRILNAMGDGDEQCAEHLLPLLYDELRELAGRQMAHESPGHTLQPTALVHEAYLRLVGQPDLEWNSRGHFFGAAAQAMRRILVDHARKRASLKRGGGRQAEPFSHAPDPITNTDPIDMLALDEALSRLEQEDRRLNEIVMLRYFAGLTVEQVGCALNLSPATVKRDWIYAKARLYREMVGAGGDGFSESD